ncbi:MAG TPA: signal peptidase II, partial [Flexilinea sp.]|nr:signal peptidase II [Flexilinea sp.]
MNKRGKVYLKLFSIALGVIFIDQLTKWFVRTNLDIRETWMPISWLEPYFRFIHWKNTGVAFGLFQGMGWILTSLGLVVILIMIFFYKPVFN